MSAGDITALIGAITALLVSVTTLVKLFQHTADHQSTVHLQVGTIAANEGASAKPTPPPA